MALAMIIAFLFEIYKGAIVLDSKDFMSLTLMAFTYYFTKPAATQVAGSVGIGEVK